MPLVGLTAGTRPLTSRCERMGSAIGFRGASGCRDRTHNGRPRTIGQLCCSIARKGVRYLVRWTVAERSSREAGLRYSAGRALRGCGRSIDQGAVRRHAIERGPAALADRAEARGFGRRASAKQARGLRDLRRRLILLADRRTADADSNSNNQPNKHIQSRPENPRGGHRKPRICGTFGARRCAYGLCRR
jgi:hypothetical protein